MYDSNGLLIFVCAYSQRSRIQVWLYEQVNMRIEGCIIVSYVFALFFFVELEYKVRSLISQSHFIKIWE